MRHNIKRSIALLLLAASLVLPSSAFAADATGNTTESLTIAATISMTGPATTATYASFDANEYSYTSSLTNIGTNNAAGLTLRVRVDPWVNGGNGVPTTSRRLSVDAATGGSGNFDRTAALVPLGTFATSATLVTIASGTNAASGRAINIDHFVAKAPFTAAGTYTSAAYWTASTN